MSDLPARPALADVLGALTGTSQRAWGPWIVGTNGVRLFIYAAGAHATFDQAGGGVVAFAPGPWVTTAPREALEILQTRGLAPEDDVRRRFLWRECSGEESGPVCTCGGVDRPREMPPPLPELIAWASLGIPAILRAEELARETVARLREYGCPQTERVVWRVGERPKSDAPAWWPTSGEHAGRVTLFANGELGQDLGWLGKVLGERRAAADLWEMGLALDSLTADAVTLVAPPAGAP